MVIPLVRPPVPVEVAFVAIPVEVRNMRITVQNFACMRAVHCVQSQPYTVFKPVSQYPTYMRQVNFFFEETIDTLFEHCMRKNSGL